MVKDRLSMYFQGNALRMEGQKDILGGSSDERFESYGGQVYAMAGDSVNHSRVAKNILVKADVFLEREKKGCEVFTSDLALYLNEEKTEWVFPDVSIYCNDLPVAVFEVLSDSTRIRDKVDKLEIYRSFPSIKDYVMVEPNFKEIAHHFRTSGDTWEVEYLLEGNLKLKSTGQVISFEEIYRNVGLRLK